MRVEQRKLVPLRVPGSRVSGWVYGKTNLVEDVDAYTMCATFAYGCVVVSTMILYKRGFNAMLDQSSGCGHLTFADKKYSWES